MAQVSCDSFCCTDANEPPLGSESSCDCAVPEKDRVKAQRPRAEETSRCHVDCWHPGALTGVAGLLVAQVAFFVFIVWRPELGGHCKLHLRRGPVLIEFMGSVVNLGFSLAFALWSRGHSDSLSGRANLYVFLSTAFELVRAMQAATNEMIDRCANAGTLRIVSGVMNIAAAILISLLDFMFLGLVEGRLLLTEKGFGQTLGSGRVRLMRHVYLGASLICVLALLIPQVAGLVTLPWHGRQLFTSFHNLFSACIMVGVGFRAFDCFSVVLRSMHLDHSLGSSYVELEKCWATEVLRNLRFHTFMQCVLLGIVLAVQEVVLLLMCFQTYTEIQACAASGVLLTEIFFLSTITGRLRPQRSAALHPVHSRSQHLSPTATRSSTWQATVHALAGRGMSVDELLEFYELLGKAEGPMPHYRPETSTTNDVVRQAIIPLSRTQEGGGAAYASLYCTKRNGELPQVMVTHTWTSLFSHLVATVVADALGKGEFGCIAAALAERNLDGLRSRLLRHGTMEQRYWICAFAVNQHAGICNGFGRPPPEDSSAHYARWDRGRRDSVTREVFAPCSCSQPKLLNDSSPERCEMNKFDDMIELLSGQVPGFAQLVAVDRNYDVFTRAWCVAEIHRAHFVGVPQRVCMQTDHVLDVDADDLTVYKKLAMLTVTDCEASRPEDKEEILGRIADTREFDAQLQEAIFGTRGLLRRQVRGFGVLEAAARTAFRVARVQSAVLKAEDAV